MASDYLLSLKENCKALSKKKKSNKRHKEWTDKLLLKSLLSNLANICVGTDICLISGTFSFIDCDWYWTEFME